MVLIRTLSALSANCAHRTGIEHVRGGRWIRLPLTDEETLAIQMQLDAAYNRCLRCHKQGHFVRNCPYRSDNQQQHSQQQRGAGMLLGASSGLELPLVAHGAVSSRPSGASSGLVLPVVAQGAVSSRPPPLRLPYGRPGGQTSIPTLSQTTSPALPLLSNVGAGFPCTLQQVHKCCLIACWTKNDAVVGKQTQPA